MQVDTTKLRDCPDFEDLSCFIDEELEATQLSSVRDHVVDCDRCASLTARLRKGFGTASSGLDGGSSGASCSDEEGLILYLSRGLAENERVAVEAHLSHCDSCVYGVSLLRKRLHLGVSVDQPVPAALREKVRDIIEAGTRDLAEDRRETPAVSWMHRVRDALDRFLRLPVLVPAAVAAGALLVVGVQTRDVGSGSSGIRAVEQVSFRRVTVSHAVVRELPRATGRAVAELKAGQQVRVASEDRDWYRVVLADDRTGWVEREAFE